jgi:hypothetical protein
MVGFTTTIGKKVNFEYINLSDNGRRRSLSLLKKGG